MRIFTNLIKFISSSIKILLFLLLICALFIACKIIIFGLSSICDQRNELYSQQNSYIASALFQTKHNAQLQSIIKLQTECKEKFIIAKVKTNSYTSTFFYCTIASEDSSKIKLGAPVFRLNVNSKQLIGFVTTIHNKIIKIRPITFSNTRLNAKTITGKQVLLIGNGSNKLTVLIQDESIKNKETVFFDEQYLIGIYQNQTVRIPELPAEMDYICVAI